MKFTITIGFVDDSEIEFKSDEPPSAFMLKDGRWWSGEVTYDGQDEPEWLGINLDNVTTIECKKS